MPTCPSQNRALSPKLNQYRVMRELGCSELCRPKNQIKRVGLLRPRNQVRTVGCSTSVRVKPGRGGDASYTNSTSR